MNNVVGMISISAHLLSYEMCPIVLCTELQSIKHRLEHFLQVKKASLSDEKFLVDQH
jgi:hypothetical protein